MKNSSCPNRSESPAMNTRSRSLVLMNYFPSAPDLAQACKHNSESLRSMMNTCFEASGKRWPNFIAVDFYKVIINDMINFRSLFYLENLDFFFY